MKQASAPADLVLLGLAVPEEGKETDYAERLRELTDGLKSWVLVSNGSLFVGDLVTPEAVVNNDAESEQTDTEAKENPAGEKNGDDNSGQQKQTS